MSEADVAATMVATFVDEWVRAGITDAVVCPGSRSTPLAVAVLGEERLRTHVHVDERSAAFTALGIGLATGRPAPVVTTSGTAAVELHPAVVEAHHGAVPMLVCTADRPPELQGIGAPQTIAQVGLYGDVVRLAQVFDPPAEAEAPHWRSWASRGVLAATGSPPGPVHANFAFREPLLGAPGPLPAARSGGGPWHRAVAAEPADQVDGLGELVSLLRSPRGVIVAGRGCAGDPAILELADRLGWPVLADPTSGLRRDGAAVAAFDALVRDGEVADALRPSVAVFFGAAPASKQLQQWIDGAGADRAVVAVGPELPRRGRDATVVVRGEPGPLARTLLEAVGEGSPDGTAAPGWRDGWMAADRAAQRVLDAALGSDDAEPVEPAVARSVLAAVPDDGAVVVSSSMPVRDLEWYGPHRDGVTVLSNRGANGIDGVVSTAVGVASTGRSTVALLGDLAFLHDSNGLLGAVGRGVDLTIVVVDNDGGGIFSFLPQAEALDPGLFERAFGTPHGLDLVAVARAFGVPAERTRSMREVAAAAGRPDGVAVLVVPTDRATNVAVHDGLHHEIGEAAKAALA